MQDANTYDPEAAPVAGIDFCGGCGHPAEVCDCDPAYEAFVEAEAARGDLAFAPDALPCYVCDRTVTVTALGPVVEARRDPTQSYRLACGHAAI